MAPAVYDEFAREIEISRDLAVIRRSRQEFKEGKGQGVRSFFSELRAETVPTKKLHAKSKAK